VEVAGRCDGWDRWDQYGPQGRWCPLCGGELRHVRQYVAARAEIVTCLRCQLCAARRPILVFDLVTGKDHPPGGGEGRE